MSNPIPPTLSEETRRCLLATSTPTIATLLYKHGFKNAFIQGVSSLNASDAKLVGPAYTLRYIAAREDTDPLTAFRELDHPQRVAVETCPEAHVLVMDCRQDASAASAGSILLTRLEVRGVAGCVTDGGIRDVKGTSELEMPVFAAKPSAPTNLTKHHAVDLNVPISCGGVPVYPGDVLVGDTDGVMVIPHHMADQIAEEAEPMEIFEEFVLEEVRRGVPIIGLYPATDPDTLKRFESWKNDRS
jgi:regulator of RNase E activity RraA